MEIKPDTITTNIGEIDYKNYTNFFDPMDYDGILPRCCCGFELIKESADTWRCVGGNHRYRMREGEVLLDKFGNMLLKKPEEQTNNKKQKVN